MQDLFSKVNLGDILQFLQECDFYKKLRFLHFYVFYIYSIVLCPSDGILSVASCQG